MRINNKLLVFLIAVFPFLGFAGNTPSTELTSQYEVPDTTDQTFSELEEVVVKASQTGRRKLKTGTNTEIITSAELKKAACCNLGESFTTNPSVHVSYTDAATRARQIKLLGLGGQNVQMFPEN